MKGGITEARAERRRLMAAGRPEPPIAEPREQAGTLEELAGDYLRARAPVLSPATIYTTEESFRLRIAPTLGHLEVTALTREKLEVFVADLAATASSRRIVEKTVAALRVILQAAVDWGRIPSNPAMGLRLPPVETHRPRQVERVIGPEQLRKLLLNGCLSVGHETLLRAAGEAGLRRGEIIALRWPDVRLEERRIEVRRSVWHERTPNEHGERKVIEQSTKGRMARRVAISERFAQRLADWYAVSVVEGRGDAKGLVWPGRDGGFMAADTPPQILERALRRAGLVDDKGRPLVSFHGLRHSAGSIMLAAGVPLIVVSRQLGHANPKITAEVYAHLLADAQLDAAAAAFVY
ncbi:MAG: site-specific integrase [Actinomycetota bacterium]